MNKKGLILNKSYDDFMLGTSVINYINRPHQIDIHDDLLGRICNLPTLSISICNVQ